jgi:GWxTD domain-containing protein
MKRLLTLMLVAVPLFAAGTAWLDRVDPLITPAEKKTYLFLKPEARREFEEKFFSDKAITAADYFDRVSRADATYGSGKVGSGANTDQGRVYLALGPPVKVTRIPSSRIFVPLEIWYYDSVPGLLNTELRLIFFQKHNMGFPKLYSPQVDTIRALLVPESATVHMLGPNDSTNESDLRGILNAGPAEDEVITASVNVASGIKYSGNEEILGRVASPAAMLRTPPKTRVDARLITYRPKLETLQTASVFGGTQVDLMLEVYAQREIGLEVTENRATVYQNQLHLRFDAAQQVSYRHRLDLLPGSYRAMFTIDGKTFPYEIEVPASTKMELHRADVGSDVSGRETPFEFDGRQLELKDDGRYAVTALARPGKITWLLRRGGDVVWRSTSEGRETASVELPNVPPGTYKLEAVGTEDSASAEIVIGATAPGQFKSTVLSFNANLAPARRYAFLGHQWLLRGNPVETRKSLQASLAQGATEEAKIELARLDAVAGNLDAARDQVRSVLAAKPDNFEALSVFAYIETRLQDYTVAAELYRRALAVQDSPAIREALAKLPAQ